MTITLNQLFTSVGKLNVGSKITVEINITSDGGDEYYAVHLHSPLVHQLQFIPGTIKINGVLTPPNTTNLDITIPDIISPTSLQITFDALILDDTPNPIEFKSSLDFLPLSTLKKTSIDSNISTIILYYNNIDFNASLNYGGFIYNTTPNVVYKMDVKPDLTLTISEQNYKVNAEYDMLYTISNNSDIIMQNVTITPSKSSNIQLVANSAEINGILNTLIDVNFPIVLPNLRMGETITVKYKFKAINTSIRKVTLGGVVNYNYYVNGIHYNSDIYSNNLNGYVYDYTVTLTQSASTTLVHVFDNIDFTLIIENTGNDNLSNVVIYDIPPKEITIDQSSILINGTSFSNGNLTSGIPIGNLSVGSKVTLTFTALVDGVDYSPIDVINQAYVTFDDNIGVDNKVISDIVNFNDLTFTIYAFALTIQGYSMPTPPTTARVGDTISYSFYIKNTGNVTAQNIVFNDTLPSNVNYVRGSLYINSVNSTQDYYLGITLPDIIQGQTSIINLQAKVNDYYSIVSPTIPQVINYAYVNSDAFIKSTKLSKKFTSANIVNPIEKTHVDFVSIKGNPVIVGANEFITYTVVIRNTGVGDATNVEFRTSNNPLIEFVPNSVVSVDSSGNETPLTFDDPEQGWIIPLIKASETLTFKYKVQVL